MLECDLEKGLGFNATYCADYSELLAQAADADNSWLNWIYYPIKTVADYTVVPAFNGAWWVGSTALSGMWWLGSTALNNLTDIIYSASLYKALTHHEQKISPEWLLERIGAERELESKPVTDAWLNLLGQIDAVKESLGLEFEDQMLLRMAREPRSFYNFKVEQIKHLVEICENLDYGIFYSDELNSARNLETVRSLLRARKDLDFAWFNSELRVNRGSRSKVLLTEVVNFARRLHGLRGALPLPEDDAELIKDIAENRVNPANLGAEKTLQLLNIYRAFDKEINQHDFNISHINYIGGTCALHAFKSANGNPVYAAFARSLFSLRGAIVQYYNGKTEIAKEILYNGLKDTAYTLGPTAALAYAALGGPATFIGMIGIQLAIQKKWHNKLFDPKKALFSKRHQLIASYYENIMSGEILEAETVAAELKRDHGIDVNDIELLSVVEDAAYDVVRNQISQFLAEGFKSILARGMGRETDRAINYYQDKLRQMGLPLPKLETLLSTYACYDDYKIEVDLLLEQGEINMASVLGALKDLNEESPEACQLELRRLVQRRILPTIDLEFQLEICLEGNLATNRDKIARLLGQLQAKDINAYRYYSGVVRDKASSVLSTSNVGAPVLNAYAASSRDHAPLVASTTDTQANLRHRKSGSKNQVLL